MKITIPVMSPLFRGIAPDEGRALMERLGASVRCIPKGGVVLREGQLKRNVGILLDGTLEMFETDADGCRSMVGTVNPPGSFAQVFAFAAVERHPATVVARTEAQILVIPLAHILPRAGVELDAVHRRFVENLLADISETAWRLRSRAFILSRRSTAERLMTYLRQCGTTAGVAEFDIPFDRQGLADFLCVDRSALSTVIGRLAKKGVLAYRKNHFKLLRSPQAT